MSVPQSIFRFGTTPLTKPASGVVYTRTFASSSAQLSWMQSKLTTVKEGNYEVRPYSGKYRGNWCADDIISCNYCMFTNGERWWFAFIDRIVYVNEQVCEFEFTIDDLQTWYFDYSLTPVFVEREHAATDVIGDNLLDEPVSTGELRYQAQDNLSAMSVQSYIVECNEEPSVDTAGGVGKVPCKTGRVNGMYSGCGKFYFDADNLDGLNTFLESMNKAGCGSSIVSIYGIPKTLVSGEFNNSQNMFESSDNIVVDAYEHTVDVDPYSALDGYTPHNNKLYTYPYNFLRVTNNGQNYHDYRFEFFENVSALAFYVALAIDPTGDCMAYPAGTYNGVNANRNEHVMLGGNPQCSWAYNSYQNWVAQNSASNLLSVVSGALPIIAGTAAIAAGGGLPMAAGAALGGATTVGAEMGLPLLTQGVTSLAGTAAKFVDATHAPNKQMGASSNSTSVQLSNNYFTFSRMCCQAQFAQRIDEFFDVFGYNTQEIKTPQINSRAHVNYIKTRSANFDGDVPAQSMDNINAMFNAGIWFFHDDSIGDFSISNPIV